MEIVLAAAASLLVQYLKNVLKTSEYATLAVLLLVAFVLSAGYVFLEGADMWDTMKVVLVGAGAIYTFLLARFEQGSALRKALG